LKNTLRNMDRVLTSGITILVTLANGLLWYIFDPKYPVPLWVVSLLIIVFYISSIIIYAVSKSKKTEVVVYKLPKVLLIHKNNLKKDLTLVVEKNELLNTNSLVTICYQADDDDFEIQLGIGYVETINYMGNLQILFLKILEKDKLKEISLSPSTWKAIRIKPTIAKEYLEGAFLNE